LRRAVYPGSFDPVTNGHLDLIRRCAGLYDELLVGVAVNTAKAPLFAMEERVAFIEAEVADLGNIRVRRLDGLAVAFAAAHDAQVIIRGIRSFSDFEYELQLAHTNQTLAPGIETVFMLSSVEWSFVSSRLIKEALAMGADISHFVGPRVLEAMRAKLGQR